ncbi:MAG: ATP-binding cassette domain-containing protein [Cytophagaceae bacterium]
MHIRAEHLGKRFNREWIFRDLPLDLHAGKAYAITGPNGSGKSTLLQIISGIMPSSEGKIIYSDKKKVLEGDELYREISLAAPYMELIEEYTLAEQIDFHLKFKPFRPSCSKDQLIHSLNLQDSINKEIRFFSSGMKTRLKLGLAFFSDTPLLLLDEPTSNLDSKGIDWYQDEIRKNISDRLVIICSNLRYEYEICEDILEMNHYKNQQ